MLQLKLIRYFNLNLLLIIKIDTSNHTTATVLLQKNRLLTFMLKKINVIKQN